MASVTIKNIPEPLYAHLKRAAKAHHRSINSELIVCLERVLLPSRQSPDEQILAARTLRKQVKASLIKAADIDAAKNEGRP
ncbi:MAG: Arc family DNA-binding protein [Candidatus Thiodiazotropha sp. (ex Dulcina madagascariensis)]|nr:Arc family DNA-binding protein [Candidatus Thiodiazotropha sp. (ex Dulcina madagascariensis)]MCU7926139.1 Arc family DNA-binding protein [Candidatus Thiodiazotropha sp. (ex Dulcina madagascariensis)]